MRLRIEPDRLGPLVDHATEPICSGLFVVVFDRAARLKDLVGAHGGVTDKDQAPISVEFAQHVPGFKAFTLAAVIAMSGMHGWMAARRRDFAEGRNRLNGRAYRIANEVPTLLMLVIVIMVVVRPI